MLVRGGERHDEGTRSNTLESWEHFAERDIATIVASVLEKEKESGGGPGTGYVGASKKYMTINS